MKNDSFCFSVMEERDTLRRQIEKMKNCINCKFAFHYSLNNAGYHRVICENADIKKEVSDGTFSSDLAACDKWEVLE